MKTVIFNNRVFGFMAREMKAAGFVKFDTDLQTPDFRVTARAMGIRGVKVEDPGEPPDTGRPRSRA